MNEKYILELSKKLKTLDESEKRKLEFKSKWYDLKVKRDIEEFVLDVTAMANTPGPVGYIIIGMREDGTLTDSPISNSNLKDESYIQHLVTKKVNLGVQFNIETFEVQNKTISVVVIPPSLDKPHVIKNYIKYDKHNKKISERDNYIPVRHGTTVGPANKTDIEYMYYDRKNIVPDYKLAFLPIEQKPIINQKSKRNDTWLTITKRFIVQNIGRYPVAISKAHLKLENLKPSISIPEKVFTNTGDAWVRVHKDRLNTINNSLPESPIIIPHNEMIEIRMEFWMDDLRQSRNRDLFENWRKELESLQNYSYSITLYSIDGINFSSDTWVV